LKLELAVIVNAVFGPAVSSRPAYFCDHNNAVEILCGHILCWLLKHFPAVCAHVSLSNQQSGIERDT